MDELVYTRSSLSQRELLNAIFRFKLHYEVAKIADAHDDKLWKKGADFSDNFANKLTGIVERSALIRVRCCNREPVNSQYARYLSSGLIGLGDGAVRGNLDAGEIFFQLHQMEAHDAYAAKLNGRKQIIDEDRIMRALKLTPDSMDESDRAVMIDHLPTIYKPHWIRLFFGINYPEVFSQFLPQ